MRSGLTRTGSPNFVSYLDQSRLVMDVNLVLGLELNQYTSLVSLATKYNRCRKAKVG